MKSKLIPGVTAGFLAAFLSIVAEAHAASGFTVTASQENAVAIGMTMSEVHQLLGRPERTARYRNAPGPIWTYRVVAPLFGKTEFNVDFGADERVIGKGQYVIGNEAPNGARH